jgi:phage protein U
MIGSYGDIVFTVSEGKVLTFDGLEKDLSARFAKHEIHLNKPILEFIGEDLAELKLSIKLDTSLGVNPKRQLDKLETSVKNGERKVLMIGSNVMGYFAIQKISQKFNRIDNRGNLLAIDIELNLMESQYDNRYSRNT